MKAFTVAAVQLAPLPGPLTAESVKGNLAKAADWVTPRVDASGAELVVLPESVTTGFTPATSPEALWDLVSEVPGPSLGPLQETARRLGVHVVVGTYERGVDRGVVHNASVLLGRDGEVSGIYRKTHPLCTEMRFRGGWVVPGDEVSGFDRVLTCDGGGTSTDVSDVSVVIDGEPTLTTEGTIRQYPSKIPMIDIVTVGVGRGSVAWVSPEGGALKVGPRSAGADPGPLWYGRGGAEPTVTDAHVVLGGIPSHLLGGEIPLDVDAARKGLYALADQLGLSSGSCATGVLEISAWNQGNALRQVTVKRGLPRCSFRATPATSRRTA